VKQHAETLSKLSGFLFLVGLFASRLSSIPVSIVTMILNLVSTIAYLVGYISWYMASLFYPDHPRKREHWFGFAQFKQQYQISALIGAIATVLCIVTPFLMLPIAWLYTISNLIWAISECHRKENPFPDDPSFSSDRQTLYVRYAVLVAAGSIIASISLTIVFLFPPSAFIVLSTSSFIAAILTVFTMYYWIKSIFGRYTPDHIKESYAKLFDQLASESFQRPDTDVSLIDQPDYEEVAYRPIVQEHLELIETPAILDQATCQ
jgi:hypothetical protein